uniref:Uncharacterized protein n=1 Tax=Steinernema glaseri TaxID=37863 RepID=A0A1I7ZAJ1_9BILA
MNCPPHMFVQNWTMTKTVCLILCIAFSTGDCEEVTEPVDLTNESQGHNAGGVGLELPGDALSSDMPSVTDEGLPDDNALGIRAKRQCCGYGGCCGYCRFMTPPTPDPDATMKPCYGCCCGCGYY